MWTYLHSFLKACSIKLIWTYLLSVSRACSINFRRTYLLSFSRACLIKFIWTYHRSFSRVSSIKFTWTYLLWFRLAQGILLLLAFCCHLVEVALRLSNYTCLHDDKTYCIIGNNNLILLFMFTCIWLCNAVLTAWGRVALNILMLGILIVQLPRACWWDFHNNCQVSLPLFVIGWKRWRVTLPLCWYATL